eukprot:CAMPEP_0182453208 /NCGR_PEP_ID=MMETSP1319-20130603/366_1 /TAXON_ID=172717 /ORGANISM="Bolidomonas pacifica, Strain RCC208" /LENGTH=270 /DNA_ID=CAMNT_0024651109 /DNA_START=302 /DNA_END=1110 /DNA_ORIENTATION=-
MSALLLTEGSELYVEQEKINLVYALLYLPYTLKPLYSHLLHLVTLRPLLLASSILCVGGNLSLLLGGYGSLPAYVLSNLAVNAGQGCVDYLITQATSNLRRGSPDAPLAEGAAAKWRGSLSASLLVACGTVWINGDGLASAKYLVCWCSLLLSLALVPCALLVPRAGAPDRPRGGGSAVPCHVLYLQALLPLPLIPGYPPWLTPLLLLPLYDKITPLLAVTSSPNLGYCVSGLAYNAFSSYPTFLALLPVFSGLGGLAGSAAYAGRGRTG